MPARKLSYAIAEKIRCEHNGTPADTNLLAEKYGVEPRMIRKILQGKAYSRANINYTESFVQRQIIHLLELNAGKGIRWFHVANERQCTARFGARLKGMGVSPGVPDMVIVMSGGQTCWLEVKSKTGKLTDHQKDWHEFLSNSGHRVATIYSIEEAITILKLWGVFKNDLRIAA